MNNICVCLICHIPNDIWIEFLSTFKKYDVYVIVDDNNKKYYSRFSNVNIIQIENNECLINGFFDMNFINRRITSWEKAMYYFSTVNTKYDKVWYFEDDVFFHNEQSLLQIDSKYIDSDLLSNTYSENMEGHKKDWLWNRIDIKFPPPYYKAMVCCVRISSKLLSKIKKYANEHKRCFFLEAMFPTMCKINNLKYDTPTELQNIVYRNNYKDADIDKMNLYHPVKDFVKHKYYRNMLNK